MGIDVTERHRLEQERQQMIRDLERYISWERLANRALTYILQENDFSKVVPEILGLIGNAARSGPLLRVPLPGRLLQPGRLRVELASRRRLHARFR